MNDRPYGNDATVFSPNVSEISAIAKGPITTITTATAHGLLDGQQVRIKIPRYINGQVGAAGLCGMPQLDNFVGVITYVNTTVFTIDVDSTFFDDFFIPGSWLPYIGERPLVVPVGSNATTENGRVINVLT